MEYLIDVPEIKEDTEETKKLVLTELESLHEKLWKKLDDLEADREQQQNTTIRHSYLCAAQFITKLTNRLTRKEDYSLWTIECSKFISDDEHPEDRNYYEPQPLQLFRGTQDEVMEVVKYKVHIYFAELVHRARLLGDKYNCTAWFERMENNTITRKHDINTIIADQPDPENLDDIDDEIEGIRIVARRLTTDMFTEDTLDK